MSDDEAALSAVLDMARLIVAGVEVRKPVGVQLRSLAHTVVWLAETKPAPKKEKTITLSHSGA